MRNISIIACIISVGFFLVNATTQEDKFRVFIAFVFGGLVFYFLSAGERKVSIKPKSITALDELCEGLIPDGWKKGNGEYLISPKETFIIRYCTLHEEWILKLKNPGINLIGIKFPFNRAEKERIMQIVIQYEP